MKRQCAYSGAAIPYGLPPQSAAPYIGERGRMIVCPACKRELKVRRGGFTGASGQVPHHSPGSAR